MNDENKEENKTDRRDFLRKGLITGGILATGVLGFEKFFSKDEPKGEKVKVLTTDGKVVEVDSTQLKAPCSCGESIPCGVSRNEAREGIPGKKFVMVIDLSKCEDTLKCQKSCQKHHFLPEQDRWLKVFKMQEAEETAPYWMPKPCFHCDHPPCVKVCPVNATYKRSDGIVLIDNERCIGCRFCMAACPYSTRSFNWTEPILPTSEQKAEACYSPETSVPRKKGTVEKCDFCPDMLRQGKLPHCVTACPNGVYYFGDLNEDTVTNGDETLRFSELMRKRDGYRYMEALGTEPSVYYLPPVNRLFPFEERAENKNNKAHTD